LNWHATTPVWLSWTLLAFLFFEGTQQEVVMLNGGRKMRVFDLFCGAGGSSCGARMAGATIVGGIDLWEPAIETFKLNFPKAKTWRARIDRLTAKSVAREIGKINLLLASPECTNHTFAKGNRRHGDEQEQSRRTAFEVVRFARAFEPRWVVVENVVSMRHWSQYAKWKKRLNGLGYHLREVVLDSQDFGVAQSRRRLFVICDRDREPAVPEIPMHQACSVNDILHCDQSNGFNYDMKPLFGCTPARAKDTLDRAQRAITALGPKKPFLIVYYGTDAAGGWQALDRPLRTITTLDRFALVRPSRDGHLMRMLQPPELAKAMGFPDNYSWPDTTRRERIKLIGNAVAPPLMRAVVATLLQSARPAASLYTARH
jgi:DNA (cytosine-5)-methyltransferase 1